MKGGRKVLYVGYWVPVWGGVVTRFRARLSPQGLQSPTAFFGTTCSSEDHKLEDGQMIPSSKICSNSCRAMASFSGESRHGLALTGGPLVWMW